MGLKQGSALRLLQLRVYQATVHRISESMLSQSKLSYPVCLRDTSAFT